MLDVIRDLFKKYVYNKPCKLIKIKSKIRFEKIGKMDRMGTVKVLECNEIVP